MKIADIYKMLCDIYEPENRLDINHYLILATNRRADVAVGNISPGRETLFIREEGDGIELGLFINPNIIATLEWGDALSHIDELACAAEGVSHLLYVADRAAKGRRVSKLELELQAEVDKFLVMHLIAAERSNAISPYLFERQFDGHSFDSNLSADEIERYETASHFAAKYCSHLRSQYFNPLRLRGLISNARDFFERDFGEKIEKLIP